MQSRPRPHDYAAWEGGADYLTGGSSQGGVVGWATGAVYASASWAAALCRQVDGLEEETALDLVYRLFGIDDLPLPKTVEGASSGPLPVEDLFEREVQKLVNQTTGNVPLYPPISAQGESERVRRFCQAVADNGCDGAMLGLDLTQKENLRIVGKALARV